MKKVAKDTNKEMKHFLGVLNEMHGENLKGIREGFIIVNKKLDSHTEMIGSLVENVSVLKSDMIIVKEDLSVIKSDLKRKVDYDDFLSLVKRVQKIEAKL
ncbi:hypothetical protein A2641_03555 [Candidatus Nomurabacteria bacterium RIFCSPHIGHO2_01_FULL_37_25]|uniref:Uncharacterized protein n=1 Tax=Candidatus Nomurabacteria bacterium RIFCSPLOWO2_01_FULL_36_16 TaxID=1801767 RepID=A0A1F6WZS7_9BACT|nr:MAG: hypothetical protein A2641_03555 [Candidatus Nomurabacteria bacterium RIFCSPHIGHO2_01_FULL_37_25]OGI75565.1 MAG: hypothetical protein A3D36_03200 [Candidatus Nomurabacteria bacterium RIFCSPHIGHO2_02_FULL_36_29]OGI87403.1 MAG: hypothetical protein A3A91_02820 [Candidatus Nomurabacteria bacterium RIFCSPLOWO2_01_FULL_36_16]